MKVGKRAKAVFYQDARGEWRWRAVATNGKIIGDSGEGYKRRFDCVRGWRAVSNAELMRQAAHVIRREADALRETHSNPNTGRWMQAKADRVARADHDLMIALADQLEAE